MLGGKPQDDSDSDSGSTLPGILKSYRPNPNKRDVCFGEGRRCVPHSSGKCILCFQRSRRCVPQTERTKRLVPRKYRTPAITGPIIPKCRRCYAKGLVSVRSSQDDACTACTKTKRTCSTDTEGVLCTSGTYKGCRMINGKFMKDGVEFTPPARGLELVDPATTIKWQPYTSEHPPKNESKCARCKNGRNTCGGRPCKHCSDKNLMCSFT